MNKHYQTLGADSSETLADIKKKFQRLTSWFHPDKQGGDEAKFIAVRQAWEWMSANHREGKKIDVNGFYAAVSELTTFAFNLDYSDYVRDKFEYNFTHNDYSMRFITAGLFKTSRNRVEIIDVNSGASAEVAIRFKPRCSAPYVLGRDGETVHLKLKVDMKKHIKNDFVSKIVLPYPLNDYRITIRKEDKVFIRNLGFFGGSLKIEVMFDYSNVSFLDKAKLKLDKLIKKVSF